MPGNFIGGLEPDDLKWVMVAVAVDTGACAHVTPTKVFSETIEETEASKAGHAYMAQIPARS